MGVRGRFVISFSDTHEHREEGNRAMTGKPDAAGGWKTRVGLVFGGRSGEHEVSLQSAKSIYEALDKDKYDVVLIGIDKQGVWRLGEASTYLLNATDPKLIKLNQSALPIIPAVDREPGALVEAETGRRLGPIDVFFPIAHGTYGEDGSLQGLLRLLGRPYVGADVLGSAVGMDKDVMKRLLRESDLPCARSLTIRSHERDRFTWEKVADELGWPVFVKPANLGSSVGISKADSGAAFERALDLAFRYDRKVLVEEYVTGREIECSVLGNDRPVASLPGEVIPQHDFYSYEAKYIDENGAVLEIPAKLDEATVRRVQELAVRAFLALECSGMARVDFFLRSGGELIINEINTLPGFTRISMYPKLWEVSGLPYPKLLDRLIELAFERHEAENRLVRALE